MSESRRFEDRIEPAINRVTNFIYGHNLPLFADASVVIIPNDENGECVLPNLTSTPQGPQLQLSKVGADRWASKTEKSCESVDVNTEDLYIMTGIAQLEIVLASQASLGGDIDSMERAVKTYKALDKDEPTKMAAAIIGEETAISVGNILAAFTHDELIRLNLVRYGVGVALASMGLRPKQIKTFQNEAKKEAVMSMNSYFLGATKYLASQAFSKSEAAECVDSLYELEPPIIEIAVSSPMNVTYLFDK